MARKNKNEWKECKETPDGGVVCEKFRDNNGEKEVLGSVEVGADGECNTVIKSIKGKGENFDDLQDMADHRVKVRCKREKANKPSDY